VRKLTDYTANPNQQVADKSAGDLFHEVCTLFPEMSDGEYAALVEDIQAHGQREPITILEGKIVDGRSRYRACKELGIEPRFQEWDGKDSLVDYVVSMNLKRRHLSLDQRAAFAADRLLPKYEEEAKKRQGARLDIVEKIPQGSGWGKARDHVAQVVGVNPRYISDFKQIQQEALDLADGVRRGEKRIVEAKRELKRRKEAPIETPPLPEGKYRTIVIDPPWDYSEEDGDGNLFGRARPPYPVMPLERIAALPVGDLAADDSHIYLWITNRCLPKGFGLLEKWGFRYITALTWVKPSFGIGTYYRGSTEHILFGVRGSLPLLRKDVGTHFTADRPGPHSGKPDEFYTLIQSCSPAPRLDMFARKERDGWTVWGNQVNV